MDASAAAGDAITSERSKSVVGNQNKLLRGDWEC